MTLMNACFRSPDKVRGRGGRPFVITHSVNTPTSPKVPPPRSTSPKEPTPQRHTSNGGSGRVTNYKPYSSTPKDYGGYNGVHRTFEDKYLTPRVTPDHRYRFESFDRGDGGHVLITDHADHDKHLNGFRSSMLWHDSGVGLDEQGSDVLTTFPPDRYQCSQGRTAALTNVEACTMLKEKLIESPNACVKLCLDVSRYAPNEIIIKLVDRKLLIEGKHFEESEFGSESCQFHRRFPIPDGTLPGDISSRINSQGVLTIRVQAHDYRPESMVLQHARFPSDSSSSSETNATSSRPATRSSCSSHSQRLGSQSSSEHRRSFYDNVDMTSSNNTTSTTTTTTVTPAPPQQRHVSFKSTPDESDGCEFIEINNDHYQLDVDVRGYSPEDLRVKVIGKELIVEGRHKKEVATPEGHRMQTSEFTKTFRLPTGINIDTMCSRVTSKGVLKVEVWKCISEIDQDYILPEDR